MPTHKLDLSFEKTNTLWDIENHLTALANDVNKVNVKLPRHHKMKFFKDSWISSFIVTASEGRELIITDWHISENNSDIISRFSNSLIGITSAFVANEINNVRHHKFNIDINEIVEHIVYDKDGMIEDSESGKSYVFCSFDSIDKRKNFPYPLALSASTKEEFIKKFLEIKREKIEHIKTREVFQLSFGHEFDRDLASLIYELYENTSQHGRYDQANNLIEGVRSFSVKRHASNNTNALLGQAQQFEELENYISALNQKKNLHFYEISISDNGIGIINRLLATRPEMKDDEHFKNIDALEQLNIIISKSLSSKLFPGSGLGLSTALKNICQLKGFLSLRTNDQWVYFDGSKNTESTSFQLQPVNKNGNLSRMKGTHYNIIIPLS